MREIKFRAWEKTSESMVYDVQNVSRKRIIGESACESFQEVIDSWEYEVMQFTGLYDKNDKEIYEGDICETVTVSGKPFGTIDVVKFINGSFQLVDIDDSLLPINLGDKDIFSVEVIGNIFEHKDLLEEGEKHV